MAGKWRTCTVDQIKADDGRAIAIGPFGSRMKADRYVPNGVAVIRGNNISDTRTLVGDLVFVSDETADELRSCNVFAGDLVFPHRGAIGQVGIVPSDQLSRYILSTSLMKLTCNQDLVDPLFIFYFFRSQQGRQALLQNASTVGTPGIGQPLASLRSISVPVPPLAEQRAIAHILGTLDDKIELNRRMNETLEAMARALFKSWFVDFDPVRAKHAMSKVDGADGRPSASSGQAFPGLPKSIADLFPDSFQDSELGEIPKGWKVEPLSEITTTITKGTTPTQADSSTADKGDGRINYVRVNSIGEDGAVLFDKLIKIPKSVHLGVLKRSILQANDVLYTIAGTIGRTAIVDESLLPANTNQAVAVVRPKQAIPAIFLAMTMQESTFREELHSNIVQAVQANLSLGTLSRARTVIPPRDTLVELFMPIADFAKRVASSRSESRALAALRDTLLPKLISGDLRLRDTEQRMKEEAA